MYDNGFQCSICNKKREGSLPFLFPDDPSTLICNRCVQKDEKLPEGERKFPGVWRRYLELSWSGFYASLKSNYVKYKEAVIRLKQIKYILLQEGAEENKKKILDEKKELEKVIENYADELGVQGRASYKAMTGFETVKELVAAKKHWWIY